MKALPNAPHFAPVPPDGAEALEVTAHLASPPVFYEAQPLDSLLSYSVVQIATRGRGLPERTEPYFIQLPLAELWRCPETCLPLWDATQFFPLDENIDQPAFWHKRGYKPHLLKAKKGKPHNAKFREGRYKEYRMPLPLKTCLRWRAYAKGNIQDISQLLTRIQAIGKKRTQGFGRISRWEIKQVNGDIPYVHKNALIKAFPVHAPLPKFPPTLTFFSRYPRGWTPPYWLETTWQDCIC